MTDIKVFENKSFSEVYEEYRVWVKNDLLPVYEIVSVNIFYDPDGSSRYPYKIMVTFK